jgi:hypothetical protein
MDNSIDSNFTQDNFKNKFRPPNPVAPLAERKRNSGLHTTLIFW